MNSIGVLPHADCRRPLPILRALLFLFAPMHPLLKQMPADSVLRWLLQLRFDFGSTAIRLLIKGH